MKLRAAIYMRVSDDQDARSRSVDQQADAVRVAVREAGWRVVAEYAEPDRSASRFAKRDRPEWARLMDGLRAGKYDVIALWEPSRGDRRLTGWSEFLDECRARNVLVYIESHHRVYDLSVPRDWRTLADEGVDSAYESEKTSMRIKRDLADAAAKGRPHGRLAYGYTREYDRKTGKLDKQVIDPVQGPIAREIITRIAGGDAVSALINDLNQRGIPGPTGGRWARSTITRLVLEGVVYIGKRRHNGGPLLDGDWPAIVSEEVYWKAHSVLSDDARKPVNGGIRPGRARWLLSYIARCAQCDGPISVRHAPRSSGQVAYYRCLAGHAVMPVEFVDAAVSEAVIHWASKPHIYGVIMRRDDSDAVAAKSEADAERARLAGFEEDAIAGRISSASFARIAAGIEARIVELEKRAESVPPAFGELLSRGSAEENVRACWEGMPLTSRRRVVAALTASPGYLRLAPGGRAHGTPDIHRIQLATADGLLRSV